MSLSLKKHPWLAWCTLLVVATGLSMAIVWAQQHAPQQSPAPAPSTPPAILHPVVIKPGPGIPHVDTGLKDSAGQPIAVSCGTCHSTTKPNLARNSAEGLLPPHRGLNYQHGGLTCLSCHNSENYDTLRLADTRAVAFPDVMTLCSQCHGTARRDYDHGSHGGMNGYWDLTKGGRTRNNCVHCHDPHHPDFPIVRPVLSPRDRISVPLPKPSH